MIPRHGPLVFLITLLGLSSPAAYSAMLQSTSKPVLESEDDRKHILQELSSNLKKQKLLLKKP